MGSRAGLASILLALLHAATASGAAPQAADLTTKSGAGRAAMAAGRYDEAAAIYAEIVKVLPNEAGMRMNLGIAQTMAGRHADAVPHLEAAIKLQPDLMPAALFLGAAHMQLGQPARAVGPLEKVVAADPANVQARQMLADALVALERWEPASRHLRKLTDAVPAQPAYWFGLGRSYEGIASVALDRLQRTAPESPWILLLTAQALVAEGRYANAYRLYREAMGKAPTARDTHEALADIYDKTGHADWAAAERERGRQSPPPDCRLRSLECEYRAGRHEAVLSAGRGSKVAEAHYWVARAAGELARAAFVRLDQLPPSPEGALIKGEVMGRQRRHVEAAAELRRAAEVWPHDARIRHGLARALYHASDFAAARPLLEELRKVDSRSAELAFLLGDVLRRLQQADAAIPHLEEAVARDPKLLEARAALGATHVQAGRPADAIPHLVAATQADEDGSLLYQLSRAYQATGQAEAATQALRKSQELSKAAEDRQRAMEEEFKITPP